MAIANSGLSALAHQNANPLGKPVKSGFTFLMVLICLTIVFWEFLEVLSSMVLKTRFL